MRNNEERLGAKKSPSSPAATQAATTGPAPLDFTRPTTIVSLPSGGRFYGEGHPLHGQDTIEIRQMTTAEEEILTNRTLLQKGVALDRFLERLMIDSRTKVDDLLVGDKNAILIQARIDGYGAEYATTVSCPVCTSTARHSFDLNEVVGTVGAGFVETDTIRSTGNNTFITTLDNGWEVEFRALTGADEKTLLQSATNRKKAGLEETPIQDQLRALIVSVSGHTDSNTINKAVQHMTGRQSRAIRDAYSKAVPNVEMRGDITCGQCGTTTELEVPLNADFFWFKS